MFLDDIPKIRGSLFNYYSRCFLPLEVAPTPAEFVHTDDQWGFQLWRYRCVDKRQTKPIKLLLVSHIINRPYILDLSKDVSVLQYLCRHGIDVFMIDWGYPKPSHRHISFAHYARYVNFAASMMEPDSPCVMGYCTGGIIALIWASQHPQSLKALMLLATPVDFSNTSDPRLMWGKMLNARHVDDYFGNIPGEMVDATAMHLFALYMPLFAMDPEFWNEFLESTAYKNSWRKWRWVMDSQSIPGAAYRQFIEDCYQNNVLIQNKMRIENKPVDLRRVVSPLLNILARYDHIVPVESGRALGKVYCGDDYREILFNSTHVGLATSLKARQHLWPQVVSWLKAHG